MDGTLAMSIDRTNGVGDEPPIYLQRPGSVKSQDVTHILAHTFRELYTKEVVDSNTIQYLNVSRGGDDEFHESYVIALQKIKEEHERRLTEAAMLERHILQAQARALSADERDADRITSSMSGYPDVCIPPARAHFRSCIDSDLLRKHNLISPEDFRTLKLPVVPPPRGQTTPHYALDTRVGKNSKKGKGKEDRRPDSQISDSAVDHRPAESELNYETNERNAEDLSPSFRAKNLWKQQVTNEERLMYRGELGSLQGKVDHLKNHHYLPPGDLLIRKNRKRCKEIGIKLPPESEDKMLPVFIAVPTVVTFKNYKAGQVYEIKLELKNVTTVLRPVRVIPPKTPYFSVGLGLFPGEHGLVAPGMSCIYAIRFSPDSLCDFDDVLQVETQSSVSPLLVPLQGRRPVPVLTVPEVLNVGHCLVGGVKVGQFIVKNEGGSGRFCIMPASSWPAGNFKLNSSTPTVQIDPFEVQPAMFELKSNELMTLEVLFAPKMLDVFSQSLVIVCDNCHVQRLTVTGESKNPEVELVSVEDYESEYELGEMADVTAQRLIRFPTLVPFIYLQETFTIRNCINVEMAYSWVVVRPHYVVKGTEGDDIPVAGPEERVQDVESAFSVEPDSGVLPPGGTVPFTLTFAPPAANRYSSVLHLVLHYFLQSSTDETLDSRSNDQWATKSLMSSCLEPKLTELTAVEIEVKGICEPYNVSVQPCVISIPGQILLETTLKKSFKMFNGSMASVLFSWTNVQCPSYLLSVEPSFGEIMPHSELMLELSITGSEPGKIDHLLECHFSPADEPITLQVIVEVKGPDLVIDQPDVNFGLVQLGSVAQSALTLRNFSRVPAKWNICETGGLQEDENAEFQFLPPCGEIRPLDSAIVGITFSPKSCRSVRTVFEISLSDGFRSAIPVYGEVQSPSVCLRECKLDIPDAFVDVAVHRSMVLVNQTLFPTPFHWGPLQGHHSNCVVRIEPESGVLQPRQQMKIDICFTSSRLGEYSGLLIPCKVCGMAKPLCLELSAVVSGLSVSYSVSDNIDGSNRIHDNLAIDFGPEIKLGATPKRFLFIKNNSGISTLFQVGCEYYESPVRTLKPPTPPGGRPPDHLNPKRKLLLVKTPNLADPVPKTKEQVHADLCKNMLRNGKGAAFHIAPSGGVLGPFAELVVGITGFSDMWGTYTDRLNCVGNHARLPSRPTSNLTNAARRMEGLVNFMGVVGIDLGFYILLFSPVCYPSLYGPQVGTLGIVHFPVTMNITGCPLYFSVVNPKTGQKPILRFGTHVAGALPVVRPTRIVNSSPVDLRLDWQMFNVCPNDDKLLDLVVCYGACFPLKDDSGHEIQSSAPSLEHDCKEKSDEDSSRCAESIVASSETERPKVIYLSVRRHEGQEAEAPFEIRPSQFVVPAFESKTIEVVFSPQTTSALEGSSGKIDYLSYALGYISLNDKDHHVGNVLHRMHQYDVPPLRVDMTAGIDPGLLSIMYEDDEEGLFYETAASNLLTSDHQLKPLFTKVSSMTLCNRKTAPLTFRLVSPAPFAIVEIDPVTRTLRKQVNKTEQISLKPQQNALIHVAFCLTPDLLEYANMQSFFSCGRMPEGNEFKESDFERKMKFQRELDIEFVHRAIQKVPMVATLVLPSLELSTDLVDFGTCLIGQTREMQITLTNRTTSDSQWSCTEEHTSHDDCSSIFELTPNSGRLNAQIAISANSQAVISIFFTAKEAGAYEVTYVFEGILGEQCRRLCVKGQGSQDGHFEALVNI